MRRVIALPKNTLSTLASSSPPTTTKVIKAPTPPPPRSAHHHQSSKQQLALLPSTQSRPSSGQATDSHLGFLVPLNLPSETLYPSRTRRRARLARLYRLDTGAYGIPKHPSSSSVALLPHTELSVQVGEDAYFTRSTSLGIADGVGGWSRRPSPSSQHQQHHHPSPSALFSRRLMHFCSFLLSTNPNLHPSQILQEAYCHTLSAHSPLSTGSSTALLAVLDYDHSIRPVVHPEDLSENYAAGCIPSSTPPDTDLPLLHIAHLGDSMAMLIRNGRIIWRTAEMWTAYNHPLQLSPQQNPGASQCSPTLPPQPHTYTLPVHSNDMLILASDGLTDNLWDEDILDEVLKFTRSHHYWASNSRTTTTTTQPPEVKLTSSPILSLLHPPQPIQVLSEALCSRAKRVASSSSTPLAATESSTSRSSEMPEKDDTTSTPFAHRAKLAGKPFRGDGKPDDISVVVALISPLSPPLHEGDRQEDQD